jgi:hypothetical protein
LGDHIDALGSDRSSRPGMRHRMLFAKHEKIAALARFAGGLV